MPFWMASWVSLKNVSVPKPSTQAAIKGVRPEKAAEVVFVLGKSRVSSPRARFAGVCSISKNQYQVLSLW